MYTKPSFKVDVQFYLMDLFKIRAFLITMIFVFTREPFLQFIDSDSFTKSFLIDDAITSTNLKAFVSFTIFLLGYEFGYYWVHRLSHKFNLLWELHQVHHYSSQMNIFVGARAHVLDDVGLSVVPYFTGTLALSLLFSGLDRETMLSASLFLYSIYWVLKRIIARLAHSHVHFSLGFLDYIFVSPRMHNGHHSREYHDLNFGQTLAIWDLVFGTFWRPPQKINYGVAGIPDDYYKNWLDCQVKPLKNIYLKLTKKINS